MELPQQHHHRRESLAIVRKSLVLLIGFVFFVSFRESFVHVSRFLQQKNLADASNKTVKRLTPPLVRMKLDGFKQSFSPSRNDVVSSSQHSALQGSRALRRGKSESRQRSRDIDSGNYLQSSSTPPEKQELDFIIAGFPKTGTTSLLHAFAGHPETDIASTERCSITTSKISDAVAFDNLQEALSELSTSPSVKRAIKCPTAVYHAYSAIVRLENLAPNAKFVIGVRHPIEMLQSFYNYRVTELYDLQKQDGKVRKIPPLETLVGMDREWRRVSTDSPRYELFLKQFGKTKVEARDLQAMVPHNSEGTIGERQNHQWAVKPNRFSIFLYTVDQLEDTGNEERSQSFREGLKKYLGLQRPLKPVGRENLNHFVGNKAYPETVDICLPRYKSLRRILLTQGTRSARWIEFEFLHSPDVFVANREHFLESIRSWSIDPCDAKTLNEVQTDPGNDGRKRAR